MSDLLERVLMRFAIEKGLVAKNDGISLTERARRAGLSPITLALDEKILTPEDLSDLRLELVEQTAALRPEAMTMPPPRAASPSRGGSSADRSSPLLNWDRYELIRLIGEGGMGRVFLARDPRLKRNVAIKFIRDEQMHAAQRFFREAQAQARVDHPNICKVYEIGENEGKPYIAMQYIQGVSLRAAARDMTLEQKLLALRQVALAVHEAHLSGLIHRDLKPSNILAERTSQGGYKPYVVDFGLARAHTDQELTQLGAVMGTPCYMPPEQARGELDKLDARADVYSLGAALYEALSGRPPFQGEATVKVLLDALHKDPTPLRQIDTHLPKDVETIVQKCMEKEPENRYATAKGLADDLGRYLDGDTIAARPAGWWRKLQKKARKNKALFTLSLIAVSILTVSMAWAGYIRIQKDERMRLARVFTQQVERVEASALHAKLAPLHDLRPDRAKLRQRMTVIETQMGQVGRAGKGPGNYALGRGFLALGDYELARDHLETAWRAGYREPEAAFALGRALGILYQKRLAEADRLLNPDKRKALKTELAADYREPALRYIKQSLGENVASAQYLAGLIAFYEERWEDARLKVGAAHSTLPWKYDTHKLEGDILCAMAKDAVERGDYQQGRQWFDQALAAYDRAALVGKSDPEVYLARGDLYASMISLGLYGSGQDIGPCLTRGLEESDRALQADPDNVDALRLQAKLHRRLGEWQGSRGQDPTTAFTRLIETAQKLLALDHDDAFAYNELGLAGLRLAIHQRNHSLDPRANLLRATHALERSVALEPSYTGFNRLGSVYSQLANAQRRKGEKAEEAQRAAVRAFEQANAIDPGKLGALINLGDAYLKQANFERDRGSGSAVNYQKALDAFAKALGVNAQHPIARYYTGVAHRDLALWRRMAGQDARADLTRAIRNVERALEINNKRLEFHVILGGICLDLALEQWGRGDNPSPALERALATLEQAARQSPEARGISREIAKAYVAQGEIELALGSDPNASLDRAIAAAEAAIRARPQAPAGRWQLAAALNVRAAFQLARGQDPSPALTRGLDALQAAPHPLLLGQLRLLLARHAAAQGDDPADTLTQARAALVEAANRPADRREARLTMARSYLAQAEWADRTGDRKQAAVSSGHGLQIIDEILERAADHAPAWALRGELLLLRGRAAASDPDPAEAAACLIKAVKLNANLAHELQPLLTVLASPEKDIR